MNVERMHAVAKRLSGDLERTNLPDLVGQLHTALTSSINAPQDANAQNQVATLREQVESALESSTVNDFAPLEMQVPEEWGVTHLVGKELQESIEQSFAGNQITPATARDEVGQFVDPLVQLQQQLNSLLESLQWFNVALRS